jgi:hypothetical protein
MHVLQLVYFRFRQHCIAADQTHRGEASLPVDSKLKAAFQTLKEALFTAPILSYLQPREGFVADIGASNVGIGGVLSQEKDV